MTNQLTSASPFPKFFHVDREFRQRLLAAATDRPRAAGSVDLLDASGSLFDLNDPALLAALAPRAVSPLRIITFSSDVLGSFPRFAQLRAQAGPHLEWRIAPDPWPSKIQESAARFPGCLIRKPVRDAHHGYLSHDPMDIARHRDYFDQLWEKCEPAPSQTTLGI